MFSLRGVGELESIGPGRFKRFVSLAGNGKPTLVTGQGMALIWGARNAQDARKGLTRLPLFFSCDSTDGVL
jgi:hypothetical protein